MPLNFSGATPLPDPQKQSKYNFSGAVDLTTADDATTQAAQRALESQAAASLDRIKATAPAFASVEKVRAAKSKGLNFSGAVDLETNQPVVSAPSVTRPVTKPSRQLPTPTIDTQRAAAQLTPPPGKSVNRAVLAPTDTRSVLGLPQPISTSLAAAMESPAQRSRDSLRSRIREQVTRNTPAPLHTAASEGGDNVPDETAINEEVNRQVAATERAATPEMIRARTAAGKVPAPLRGYLGAAASHAGGALERAGGIADLGGLLSSALDAAGVDHAGISQAELADYLKRKGQFVEEASSLPPLDQQGNEIARGVPEKLVNAVSDLGMGIVEIVGLQRATGLPMGRLMAIETALKNTDQPATKRASQIAESYAMGKMLEGHLSRAQSAAAFGGPTAIQGASAVAHGQMSPLDALLQTGVQASVGVAFGGKPKLVDTGETRPPQQGEYFRLQNGEIKQASRDYSSGEFPILKEVTHHSQTQSRAEDGTFVPEKSEMETTAAPPELRIPADVATLTSDQREAIKSDYTERQAERRLTQSQPPEGIAERRVTPERRVGALGSPPEPPRTIDPATVQANIDTALADVERANTAKDSTVLADSLQRAEDAGATPKQIAATLKGGITPTNVSESVPKVVPSEPETSRLSPERASTSIKNAAVEADREAKDLPLLTPADHKSWIEAGERAREQGLDQPDKADAIAESVLSGKKKQLTDEESAGLRDRLRSIENQYEDLSRRIWESKDPAEIEQLRSEAATLKSKFVTLTDVTKKAGTEIARALAIRRSAVNRDFSLVGMERDFKVETGKEPTPEIKKQIEDLWKENGSLKTQLADYEAKLAEKNAERAFKRLKNDAINEQKRVARRAEKADLDKEAAELKDLIAKEAKRLGMAIIGKGGGDSTLQPSGLGSLDELSTLVTRLARNRLKANLGLKASELAQEVHGLLNDVVDIDERQVREMIVGYGRKVKRQSELQRLLNAARSELRQGLEAEDVAAGRRSASRQGPSLSDINKFPRQGPPRPPKQGPPNTWPRRRAQLEKQIAEYERKIREEDFSEKEKRPAIVYDRAGNQLRSKLEATRRQFEALKEANKPATAVDLATRWKRFSVLGYPTTLGKLGAAATGRMVATPIYNLVDVGARRVPGLRSAFTDTAKPTLKGEYKAVSQLWQSDTFRDILSHLRGGDDLVSLLYGERGGDEFVKGAQGKSLIPRTGGELLDRPGHYHAALKTIPKRAAFFREFENRLQEAERAGRDVTDPAVQLAIAAESYPEAQRAILQQRNPLSNAFNQLAGNLSESKYMAARALGKGLKFEFPITKVPVNFVGETLQHIGGLPASLGEIGVRKASSALKPILSSDTQPELLRKLAQRLPDAMSDLEPEQRQRIARGIKVGGVGLGFVLWGMMRPDQFGGYYQPGKRDPNDVKFGGMRFMGVNIPRYLGHIPPLEAAQFGSTIRRVYDSMTQKNKEGAAGEAVKEGAKGLAEEVPFLDPLINAKHGVGALFGAPGERQKYLGGEVRSMVPGFVQQSAKSTDYPSGTSLRDILNPFSDKEPIARKPTSVGEEFKMGIPGLRQTVPISPVFGFKSTKGSEEVQRLGVPVRGVLIKPDESVEDYKARQKAVDPVIGAAIDALVDDDEYKSLSDTEKIEAIKLVIQDVGESYRETQPRKEPKPRVRSRQSYQFSTP